MVTVIKHTPSNVNKVVDALSRKGTLLTLLKGEITAFNHLKELYPSDPDFKDIWYNCTHYLPAKDF